MSSFFTVLKKELIDIVRDRKTLIFTLVLPILIYPLLFKVMGFAINSSVEGAINDTKIVIQGDSQCSLVELLKAQEGINIVESLEPTKDLKEGKIQLIVNIDSNFDEQVLEGNMPKVEIFMDDESNKSQASSSIVNSVSEVLFKTFIDARLQEVGLNESYVTPYVLEVKSGVNDDGSVNDISNMIIGMIPSLVVLILISLSLGLASELGAGEKEKNTFEPLLSTAGNRDSILWGKIVTLTIVGIITLIFSMASLIISFRSYTNSLSHGEEIKFSLEPKALVLMIVFLIFIIVIISALQICISLYARSTKEANTYLSGILMPVMILCFIPMYIDIKNVSDLFFHIPILNTLCVLKEGMVGIFSVNHITTVFIWQIAYVIIAVIAAKIMFSREEVVFRS